MCGIFGIYDYPEAAHLSYLGLHSLQHRGQEGAGITVSDGERLRVWRGLGLVVDVFDQDRLAGLTGTSAIGHVRYSTSGESSFLNVQPFVVKHLRGELSMAHNGNLVNANALREELEKLGSIFTSTSDSEVIMHLYARTPGDMKIADRIAMVMPKLSGAFSCVFLTERKLIAVRDPFGFRPLALGRMPGCEGSPSKGWVVASETCAFDLIGATYIRAIEPGEIVVIDREGVKTRMMQHTAAPRFCIFEHVYFARPDSLLGTTSVYSSRRKLGRQLATESPCDADVVIPVPDSGTTAALGFSDTSGIPFEMGLIRSHYVGRTFIEPQQSIRHFGVRLKLSPVKPVIEGKRVVVVDDSLVRGTTSKKIVTMLRQAGAKEVHMRISSPPVVHPCFFGIDTPDEDELIAHGRSVSDVCQYIGADSLAYLSLSGMVDAVQGEKTTESSRRYCEACFSGNYPVSVSPVSVSLVAGSQNVSVTMAEKN